MKLPGLTAEMPIILAADEGRSSKTYTLLLYSNASAAAAVRDLVLPQEAAAAASAAAATSAPAAAPANSSAGTDAGRSSNSSRSQAAADAAALSAAYFAGRPAEWPRSPAQSEQCSVCPNGTYSTRTDALECKVGRGWLACVGASCCAGACGSAPLVASTHARRHDTHGPSAACWPLTPRAHTRTHTQVCPPGKYAASPFSTGCLYCPPGSFSYYWGAPTCRPCLPGTFAADAGSLFCDICRCVAHFCRVRCAATPVARARPSCACRPHAHAMSTLGSRSCRVRARAQGRHHHAVRGRRAVRGAGG
jgi:hypothetical protein